MFEMVIEGYRWFFLRLADCVGLGLGVVMLSFITSAAMAPLMRVVAGVVKRETEYQGVILPQIAEIKRKYASDIDCNLHIQRLYARYGYYPISAVKKVLPLFVQIPFLLLTYFMLKGTMQLNGVQFLFLRDLGQPDGLLAAFGVNILPIVMTGVNILTVFATPGFTSRDWTQAIGISILFLLMLYTAPSALLLYWTLNNVITMVRTLVAKRAEGAKLLGSRVIALRGLPQYVRERSTDANLSLAGLVALLVALYMRLMVYMEVWFFNRFASYWLMNEVLAVALVMYAISRRKDGFAARWTAIFAACASSIAGMAVLMSLALLPITPKGMMFVNAHFDLAKTFDLMFALGMLPVAIGVVSDLRAALRAIGDGFAKSAHWFVGIAILAVHYSFASQNFKLPVDAVALLAVYLLVPAVFLSILCLLTSYRSLAPGLLVCIGAGVSIGAYLIPMVSLDEGKLLGYGSNLLVRFVLMGCVAFFLARIKSRKAVLVFMAVLGAAVVVKSAISKYRISSETESQVEAMEGSEAQEALLNAPSIHTNTVYLLIYDGYAPDIVLDGMKVKGMGLRDYLGKRGFVSYDAYSVGSDTVVSMGNAFNIGGVVQGSVRSSMAGNNVFCDYLRRHGYTTSYVLGGYDMPNRGERMPGDFYFPTAREVARPEMVLYPCIIRGILSQSANVFNSYTYDEWLSVKRGLIESAAPGGQFIYAHSEMPSHVTANPTYRKSPEEERRRYEERIALADRELQADMDILLAKNDDSIIIVASDHGSHLSLPARDSEYDAFTMLDRVGVQLHVRWPRDYTPCLQLKSLQNLFLEIEIYLSGDRSLGRFALPGETLRIPAPLRAPEGSIVDGIIQRGPDKGSDLFEAARRRADKLAM